MKRAFTLIEMMIVVAIIAVLMTITFRLTKASKEDNARTETILKLQKVENCLSGYYAAFGSYPPVKLHGSRDFRLAVDNFGDQDSSQQAKSGLDWGQVQAACRSQPFGCEYPPEGSADEGSREINAIKEWSKGIAKLVNEGYTHYQPDSWRHGYAFTGSELTAARADEFPRAFSDSKNPLSDWNQGVRLFKFGMMSYLLPRYLFMMRSTEGWFGEDNQGICLQWSGNNSMPSDPIEGKSYSEIQEGGATGWELVRNRADSEDKSESEAKLDRVHVENIPSQAVCARWMPNLDRLCVTTAGDETFFGINISNHAWTGDLDNGWVEAGNEKGAYPPNIVPVHRLPSGSGGVFCNGCITIKDGWDRELYYYSPAPYQSYIVWSSGPNRETFPPWVSMDELSTSERKTAMEWKADDLMEMGEGIPGKKQSNPVIE